MGNKIVTEADRKRTAAPTPLPGTSARTGGRGQRVSLERGVSTRSKKNPGKRPSKGGWFVNQYTVFLQVLSLAASRKKSVLMDAFLFKRVLSAIRQFNLDFQHL